MAAFRFILEPVLEQRRRAEELCQLAVAAIERQRLDSERAIRECQQGLTRERAELRRHLGGSDSWGPALPGDAGSDRIGLPAGRPVRTSSSPAPAAPTHGPFPGGAGSSGTASGGSPMPPVALRDARLQAAAAMSLDARARQEVLRLAGLHKRLDAARSELLKAATARKAVELLRDRRREAWRQEQSRLESAAVDELAVMQAARRDQAP